MSIRKNREGAAKSRNPIVRLSNGVFDFIDNYQEVVAEARRRYPDSFR